MSYNSNILTSIESDYFFNRSNLSCVANAFTNNKSIRDKNILKNNYYTSSNDCYIVAYCPKHFDNESNNSSGYGSTASVDNPVFVFTTPEHPGAKIRNAKNGLSEHDFFVGTKEESLFFKVRLSNGCLPAEAKSKTLFFNSKKEYEEHLNIKPETACGSTSRSVEDFRWNLNHAEKNSLWHRRERNANRGFFLQNNV